MKIKQLKLLFIALCLSASFFGTNLAQEHGKFTPLEVGNANAPVILYDFFAFSCGHCGTLYNTVLTKLKNDLVKQGLVKIVYIHYPIYPPLDFFAHSVLATTTNTDTAVRFMSSIFANQQKWATSDNPNDIAKNYALLVGISQQQIAQATDNEHLIKWFENIRKEYKDLDIKGTPTLFLVKNGDPITKYKRKFVGTVSYTELTNAIQEIAK